MTEKISKDDITDILNIVLCISAKDGVLSDIELEKARVEFPKFFGRKVSNKKMESVLDDFFSSTKQIEDYLDEISKDELKKPILLLSILSASADGFDIRENIAYQKSLLIWGYDHKEIHSD